ncbi:uncharacterized protein [Miscanthus floridulus]|uniref:uncharacterized protein isoform X2 n=1 Tax=Miscanthus floridulus TaxID=154761 RepID=UPI0034581622
MQGCCMSDDGYLVTDKDLTEDGSDDRYLTIYKDSTKDWSDESPTATADAMEGGIEPWATSVGETSSPAECLDKRKLSDDWMKQSYHCRKIRRLQRDTVSLDLQVMVLQLEMTRLYADQAEVTEMISDLKKFFFG